MTTKKKIIVASVSAAVLVSGVFAGYHINRIRRESNTVADVYPISLISMGYMSNEMSIEGTVTAGNVQRVKADESQLIDQILVHPGDTVKKGDPILKYDTTLVELDLEEKKNTLAVTEDNIKQTQKEIDRLQRVKPMEDMPEIPQPTLPPPPEAPAINTVDSVNDTASKKQGTGTPTDPFVFLCNKGTMISAEFMTYLMQNKSTAEFDVYIDDQPSYKWVIYGEQLTREMILPWCVSDGVEFDDMGQFTIDMGAKHTGRFGTLPPDTTIDELYEEYYDTINNMPEPTISKNYDDDYTYSKAELARMITEKQGELEQLQLDKKRADVDYRKAQSRGEDGTLYSTIDGVVTISNAGVQTNEPGENTGAELNPDANGDMPSEDDSDSLIVIRGQGSVSVTAAISEYDLDKVEIGDTIMVMSYETGTQSDAVVTDVDTTPVENYYSPGNPNSSGYKFTADITGDAEGFKPDSMVSVSVTQTAPQDSIYLPVHFIREDEGGPFVLKAGKDELLEKQYVKTGAVSYGSYVEVKSGIKENDMICFPYGKNIKEGIKFEEKDEPPQVN